MASTPLRDADIEGFLLEQHAKPRVALASSSICQDMIEFESGKKNGRHYAFPVTLQFPDATTYTGSGSANYGTAVTLADFNPGVTDEAKVLGREMVERCMVSYGTMSRSAESGQSYRAAFEYQFNLSSMAAQWKSEAEHLYGGGIASDGMSGIGAVESSDYSSGTTCNIVIKAESWSPGIMNMLKGQHIDIWDADLNPQVNTNAVIRVTGVTASTRTLALSGNATDLGNIAADDLVFFKGWQSTTTVPNSHYGIYYHLANTGSIHDISASTHPLWQSQSVSNKSKALSPKSIFDAVALISTRCMMPSEYIVLCSSFAWADVNNNLSGWKQFGENTTDEMRLGTKKVGFDTAMVKGDIRLIHHPMVKAGHAMVIAPTTWKRVGSSELRLGVPGAGGANSRFYVQGIAGLEAQLWSDYGIVNCEPNTAGLITDIVNNDLPT